VTDSPRATTGESPELERDLSGFLSGEQRVMRDPYALYAELRERAPVVGHGPFTFVSRYEDVRDVYLDDERFKKRYFAEGTLAEEVRSRVPPELADVYEEVDRFEGLFLPRTDDELHARLRKIAHRAFTPRMVAGLQDYVQECTDELLEAASAHPEVDLTEAFTYRLPLLAIAQMLGVPPEDAPMIHRWSSIMGQFEGRTNMDALLPWHEALAEFRAYVHDLVQTFRDAPPDTNLTTALLDARSGDRLSQEELLAMFVVLLFAGHETTTNLIGNGLVGLMRQRDQWELMCRRPELMETAVEELLRYDAPVQYTARVPIVDAEVGGVPVAAGQTALLLIGSANRDPRVFPDPDRIDITRAGNRHLSLLVGIHFCLGASLARLEGKIAFSALSRRFPECELVESELPWNGNPMLRGVRELPVRLGAPAAER
jgi:cytochrome P450